ncbi:nucleoside hydrolase [Treponema sp. HNW]|uniref:nucleoside hydrolase n=1 Tax=Treponema sp. HNW TaxID=3116654 RepID=UPI003D107AA6
MKKILFDSDLLGDDLLALLMMSKDNDVEITGITAYGRRMLSIERCRMACVFLEELGTSNIRLVPGVSRPLVQEPISGCRYCDDVLKDLLTLWSEEKKFHNTIEGATSAASFIIDTVKKNPLEFSLLCTGPLTNIALAVSLCPELPHLLKEIVIMGGTWKECGNSSAVAEANIYNDPEAAKIVFSAFPSITVVPLDVTMKVTMSTTDMPKSISPFISRIITSCCNAHHNKGESFIMPMHDVLAFLVLKYPELTKKKRCLIRVETRSSKSRGMMVFDFSRGNHMLCYDVDAKKAIEILLSLLEP